jgi:7-cyano-7-deazaguanine synthase in queuosine biosynthesis
MSETLVLCGGTHAPRRGAAKTLRLNLGGSNANVSLQIEDIRRRMVADIPDVLTDLLEVATYVYCADQLVSRGGEAAQALGADWRRQLSFVVPVREPDLWTSPEVSASLARLLTFMSDEDLRFEFVPASSPAPRSSYFEFPDQEGAEFLAEEVALFSGGLDSLAGAVETLEQGERRLLLVSHQASPKLAGHQLHLVRELRSRFPGKVLHVPVRITKRADRTVEFTQRTRSFLFAALAMVVGHLTGSRLRFYENGVVSFNLPIATQVVGARATRSTHPRVMRDLDAFLSALLGQVIEVQNPYIWKTKTEVASVLAQSDHSDLLPHSVSCSHVYNMTKLKTHCGRCSQCLDRRFATLAGGLGDTDPEEMYEVDLLTGPRDEGVDRTMAESFVRHAREFVKMSDVGFVGRFGGHVARAAGGFPGLAADQVVTQAISLHQRHGQAVMSALELGFKKHARALAEGTLPGSCILRLVGEGQAPIPPPEIRDPTERESSKRSPLDGRDFGRTSEIRLAVDVAKKRVLIRGIEPIRSPGSFSLVAVLVEAYETDRSERRAPENHRYVKTLNLTQMLRVNDLALRRRVERLRRSVAGSYERCFGLSLGGDAVIQNQPWRGYRLNPLVRVVAPDQIDQSAKRHELDAERHDSSTGASKATN